MNISVPGPIVNTNDKIEEVLKPLAGILLGTILEWIELIHYRIRRGGPDAMRALEHAGINQILDDPDLPDFVRNYLLLRTALCLRLMDENNREPGFVFESLDSATFHLVKEGGDPNDASLVWYGTALFNLFGKKLALMFVWSTIDDPQFQTTRGELIDMGEIVLPTLIELRGKTAMSHGLLAKVIRECHSHIVTDVTEKDKSVLN